MSHAQATAPSVVDDDNEELNEICTENLAVQSLNATALVSSPMRLTMFGGHFAQRPVIAGSEPNLIQTGVAEEMGKYTFSVKMPQDGVVLLVLPRYPAGVDAESINFNPERMVFYRADDTGEIDCFSIPYHASYSPTFGFSYEMKPTSEYIAQGAHIQKDTVFADTPANKGAHHYTYSRNLNIAYMSHPNVGLDGYLICRDVLHHFAFKVYEERLMEVGASDFPLNLYGDDHTYRIFPEIGDLVREDGLLMASRHMDPYLAAASMSVRDTQTINEFFDEKIYARAGVGRVVDVKVWQSENINRRLPPAMTAQLERYAKALQRYYREIIKFEERMIQENRMAGGNGRPKFSPKLIQLIVEAKGTLNARIYDRRTQSGAKEPYSRQNLTLVHRKNQLDGWRIKVVVEYEIIPNRGNKFSCDSGGKGVISRIAEPEEMPVDEDGNRADIIASPEGISGRTNFGRLYQPYINGAARDVRRQILEIFGYDRHHVAPITSDEMMAIPEDRYQTGVATYLEFQAIVSPRTYEEFTRILTDEERFLWMLNYINTPDPITYIPIETEASFAAMVQAIEKRFKVTYGPVTYRGLSGRLVKTKNKVRIGRIPIMLLDKIADTWLSVDIGKHSSFGILAAMNNADKHSSPWRKSNPKLSGETESGLYVCYGSRLLIAEMFDRWGNLASQRSIAKTLLTAENPSQIDKLIDRTQIGYGNARPIQIIQHYLTCAGARAVYKPEAFKK